MGEIQHLMLQVQHYDLLILLHLPFMMSDPTESRYDYSKNTCTQSSREVLKRFITFRSLISTAYSCRHVDYSALIAAMTFDAFLPPPESCSAVSTCAQRAEDRSSSRSSRSGCSMCPSSTTTSSRRSQPT